MLKSKHIDEFLAGHLFPGTLFALVLREYLFPGKSFALVLTEKLCLGKLLVLVLARELDQNTTNCTKSGRSTHLLTLLMADCRANKCLYNVIREHLITYSSFRPTGAKTKINQSQLFSVWPERHCG